MDSLRLIHPTILRPTSRNKGVEHFEIPSQPKGCSYHLAKFGIILNPGETLLIRGIKVSPLVGCIKITVGGENLSVLNEILKAFGENKINIWFEVQLRDREDVMGITLCVTPPEVGKVTMLIKAIAPHLDIFTIPLANIISVFPYRDNPEIAFLFLRALEEKSIPVLAISTSLSSLSCLVHHEQCSLAQESLKKTFNLS